MSLIFTFSQMRESNLGRLGRKRKRYLWAMPSPWPSPDQFKDPVVYLMSPVWDFGGGSWLWNWTELNLGNSYVRLNNDLSDSRLLCSFGGYFFVLLHLRFLTTVDHRKKAFITFAWGRQTRFLYRDFPGFSRSLWPVHRCQASWPGLFLVLFSLFPENLGPVELYLYTTSIHKNGWAKNSHKLHLTSSIYSYVSRLVKCSNSISLFLYGTYQK